MSGVNCCTDHVMIKSTSKPRVRRIMRKDKMPIRKLVTNPIKINIVKHDLLFSLNDRLVEIPAGTVEKKWNAFKSIVYTVSKQKFTTAARKHDDCFDWNIMDLEKLINNRSFTGNWWGPNSGSLWSTLSLTFLPGPLLLGVVVSVLVLLLYNCGRIFLYYHLSLVISYLSV